MRLPVRFFEHGTEEPLADLKVLPSRKLQQVALEWLSRVARKPDLGASLDYQPSTGDLGDRFKLYFDEDDEPLNPLWMPRTRVADDPRPRYRIVYRLAPSPQRPEFVEVISIGPKPDVYRRASERLERLGSSGS